MCSHYSKYEIVFTIGFAGIMFIAGLTLGMFLGQGGA